MNASSKERANVTYIKITEIKELQILANESVGKSKQLCFIFSFVYSNSVFFIDRPTSIKTNTKKHWKKLCKKMSPTLMILKIRAFGSIGRNGPSVVHRTEPSVLGV